MKFWYPVKIVEEIPLPGVGVHKRPHPEIVGPGHLLVIDVIHGDKLLCGANEYAVLRDLGVTKKITRDNIIAKAEICQECQEAYKNMPQGPWRKWTGK